MKLVKGVTVELKGKKYKGEIPDELLTPEQKKSYEKYSENKTSEKKDFVEVKKNKKPDK